MEAFLILETGHTFLGNWVGASLKKPIGAEVVFNTGHTGYQEILTDPSYFQQFVVMTTSHVGNTGINNQDNESLQMWTTGLIVNELDHSTHHFQCYVSLAKKLESETTTQGILKNIDTRRLTLILRKQGSLRGVIFPGAPKQSSTNSYVSEVKQIAPDMNGADLVSQVSCKKQIIHKTQSQNPKNQTLVLFDFGTKKGLIENFLTRGFDVTQIPYDTSLEEVQKIKPSGIILSNGPGDPGAVSSSVIETLVKLKDNYPIFAVCMGHQLLGRALGYKTKKLSFGHHGINHPVQCLETKDIYITSQNHGFALDEKSQKDSDEVFVSHVSLNDGSISGIGSRKYRLMSYQFHPESRPGPTEASSLFDEFVSRYLI